MVESAVFLCLAHLSNPSQHMKIAFLIQDISTAGGTERTTCCLAEQLRLQGHEVSIVSAFKSEKNACYSADNVEICYLTEKPYTAQLGIVARLWLLVQAVSKVRKCAVMKDADWIICQKIAATVLAFMAGFRHKSIAAEHFKYGMYTPFLRRIRHRLYSRMRAVVTLTEKDKHLFVQEHLREVYCIPNMVSVTPMPYHGWDSNRIISVGRLTMQKGYDLLLQAVAKIADEMGDFYIDIYGDGEEREALVSQCQRLNLTEKVHFRGYTTSIENEYANSAFYVMSSRFEGFPMVLLEAAACGLPIVSFDCPEGPAILLKNGGGILVEKENVNALSAAILTMIQNPEKRQQYREQLQHVIEPYSPQQIGKQWEELLTVFTHHNTK